MKNHFIFGYSGNKRLECIDIYNSIKPILNSVNTIIEPFCGSSAISYYISTKHPKKYKYILNDNSKRLINVYKLMKDEDKYNKLIDDLEKMYKDIFNKDLSEQQQKEKYNKLLILTDNDYINTINYIFINKYRTIRAGLFPMSKKQSPFNRKYFEDVPILKFLREEDITLLNEDGTELVDKNKNNENVLLILDPPYLNSCNSYYDSVGDINKCNIYEYTFNNKIDTYKAKIILIIENIWINKLLYNNLIKQTYNKLYQPSKRKTEHIIVSNY